MNKRKLLIAISCTILITIVLSYIFNNKDEKVINGNRVINSTEKINLGGVKQSVSVKTNDSSKPVLLIIHGGPGFVLGPIIDTYNSDLQNNYIVVNWDQRGAGKSYDPEIIENTMTLKHFVSDAHELTGILKKRYNKKKIFIMGHSFGTVIGMQLVQKYPNDYIAYISCGQVVSFIENEKLSYKFALESARNTNNIVAINELEKAGEPDNKGNYKKDSGYDVTYKWMVNFGGELCGKYNGMELFEVIKYDKFYKKNPKILNEGIEFSQAIFDDKGVKLIDFRKQVPKVKIPVYFIIGNYDYDTPFELVKEYYEMISAPNKQIVWFQRSAHFPFYEEPVRFNKVMEEIRIIHEKK